MENWGQTTCCSKAGMSGAPVGFQDRGLFHIVGINKGRGYGTTFCTMITCDVLKTIDDWQAKMKFYDIREESNVKIEEEAMQYQFKNRISY